VGQKLDYLLKFITPVYVMTEKDTL